MEQGRIAPGSHLGAYEAIDAMQEAIRLGFPHREAFENDPDLNELRGDPRFQALIERL